jgi:F-type H+-transporting ATPase subunit epsilon
MAALFPFELVLPEKLLFSGDVEAVVLSSIEGEMTIMANHAPVMAVLKPALLIINDGKGHAQRLYVRGGFADIRPNGVTVLAETAVPVDDLSVELIDADIRDAQEDLDDAKDDEARRIAFERLSQLQEARGVLIHRMAMLSKT